MKRWHPTATQSRRPRLKSSPPWEPQILHEKCKFYFRNWNTLSSLHIQLGMNHIYVRTRNDLEIEFMPSLQEWLVLFPLCSVLEFILMVTIKSDFGKTKTPSYIMLNSTNINKLNQNKVVPVLNKVSRHEDISCTEISTTPWRRVGERRYSSRHS